MKRFGKFGLAVAVATLALVLNGCGSSSETMAEPMPMPEPPPPTAVETAEMELDTAKDSLMGLVADASGADRLAAQQAVLAAAQKLVMELQGANAVTNEVTAAQAMVADYEAMVAATVQANAKAERAMALAMAKESLMGLAADASHADMLVEHQAVVDAAQAVVDGLVADDAPHAEVAEAMAIVTDHEAEIEAINMAIADATEAARLMEAEAAEAASLMEAKDALTMAKATAAEATSYADMLEAQMAVVAAALVVADEAGASEADVEAANADVAMYEDMIEQTEEMKSLELVGGKVKSALEAAHTSVVGVVGTAGGATATKPKGRADAWLELDPTKPAFDSDGDGTIKNDVAQFTVTVSNQEISVTATSSKLQGARDNAPTVTATSATAYNVSADRDAPSLGEDWRGIMHERTYVTEGRSTLTTGDDVTVMDIATTYTNQEASEGKHYNEIFPPSSKTLDDNDAVASVGADGMLSLAETAQGKANSSGFPAVNQQTFTYNGGTGIGSRPVANAANPLIGTYYGVPGKFTCTDASCGATRNASGGLSLVTKNWRFTPDGDPSRVRVPLSNTDLDYLTFGYWIEEVMDAETATTSYRVGAYYPIAGSRTGAINSAVTGSAMYMGPAAGLFAKRVYDPESQGTVETAGRFTAHAALTADFDRAQFATDDDGSISGTITNFMHDGEMIDPQWSVTMTEGTIDADGNAPSQATFVSDPAKQAAGDGSQWTGRFYGHYTVDDTDTPVDELSLKPTGVAGAFSNTFDNGEVLGAFGATR